jgi:hypothetical protein
MTNKPVNQKQRGNRFERKIVNSFKKIGYKDAATSRMMSKHMDNLGIDLVGIPYLVQCKYGKQKGINYSDVIKNITTNIKGNKELEKLPIIVFHTKDGRQEENKLIIMQEKDLWKLLTEQITT